MFSNILTINNFTNLTKHAKDQNRYAILAFDADVRPEIQLSDPSTNVRHVLGVLVDKKRSASAIDFSRLVWNSLPNGPALLQPKRFGNWEPLKPVAELDLETVLGSAFFFSNGRRSSGSVFHLGNSQRRYYKLTLHLTGKKNDETAERAYRWLADTFPFTYCYSCGFSPKKIKLYPDALQLISIGLFEQDIPEVLKIRHVFEHFELGT